MRILLSEVAYGCELEKQKSKQNNCENTHNVRWCGFDSHPSYFFLLLMWVSVTNRNTFCFCVCVRAFVCVCVYWLVWMSQYLNFWLCTMPVSKLHARCVCEKPGNKKCDRFRVFNALQTIGILNFKTSVFSESIFGHTL